jgi:hypothetical protein
VPKAKVKWNSLNFFTADFDHFFSLIPIVLKNSFLRVGQSDIFGIWSFLVIPKLFERNDVGISQAHDNGEGKIFFFSFLMEVNSQ